MWPVIWRVSLYALILAILPLVSASWPKEVDPFWHDLGLRFGLVGFAVLMMQFVLSARNKWAAEPFGLDQVFRFHKAMAVLAAVLLVSHPFLIATSRKGWEAISPTAQSWPVPLGIAAIFVLLMLLVISLFRIPLRIEFQGWRIAHNALGTLLLAAVSIHAFVQSWRIERSSVPALIAVLFAFAVAVYVWHIVLVPAQAKQRDYQVTEIKQETHDAWTVTLAPRDGVRIPDYRPGQFLFLTLYRQCGPPSEEHPFTISTSPTCGRSLGFTIKQSGDYTSTIGSTRRGDRAAIQGPFGSFAHVLRPEENDLVFIAGGIGITPLMSMLRHLRDTSAETDVSLLYFNKTQDDIVFREELAAMERGDHPRIRVMHVLSRPDESWQGEAGRADRDTIDRLVTGELTAKSYYICGPGAMMSIVIKALTSLGVPASRIHYERFAL